MVATYKKGEFLQGLETTLQRARTVVVVVFVTMAVVAMAAGCGEPRPPVAIHLPPVAPSDLVVVEAEPLASGVVGGLVADTARWNEWLVVAAPRDQVLARGNSGKRPPVIVPGIPHLVGAASGSDYIAPEDSEHPGKLSVWQKSAVVGCFADAKQQDPPPLPSADTKYQTDKNKQAVKTFAKKTARACETAKANQAADLRAWASEHSPEHPPAAAVGLSAALATARDELGSLEQAGGIRSRVIVVFTSKLGGTVPAGSLTGDTVVVVSSAQPSVDVTDATQANLYGGGAASVKVLGPAVPSGTIAGLVRQGLAAKTDTVTLAGVLFENNSFKLLPGATQKLEQVLGDLRTAGSTAVINGYASSTGNSEQNLALSQARAEAVATWLQNHGAPDSAVSVSGHGSHYFVAPGPSPSNRRVTVIISQPNPNP